MHGVRVVQMPWAEPHSRFTALLERLAIEWLRAASQKAVAERLELSWEEIHESWSGRWSGDYRILTAYFNLNLRVSRNVRIWQCEGPQEETEARVEERVG